MLTLTNFPSSWQHPDIFDRFTLIDTTTINSKGPRRFANSSGILGTMQQTR